MQDKAFTQSMGIAPASDFVSLARSEAVNEEKSGNYWKLPSATNQSKSYYCMQPPTRIIFDAYFGFVECALNHSTSFFRSGFTSNR